MEQEASAVSSLPDVSGLSLDDPRVVKANPEGEQKQNGHHSGEKPKVVFVTSSSGEPEDPDLFPIDPLPEPRMKESELVTRMSTIKGSVKRQDTLGRRPSEKKIIAKDLDVIVEDDKVYVTLPWQSLVPLEIFKEAVKRTAAKHVEIDLQGSTLQGGVWDVSHLSTNANELCVCVENGVLDLRGINGTKGKSKFEELDFYTSADGCTLVNCSLELVSCSVVGNGTFILANHCEVTMTDCEVTEADGTGLVISQSHLKATRTKFVDHGQTNVEVAQESEFRAYQCDFIGSKRGEGLVVKGKGTKAYIQKSTFINNELCNMLACDGSDIKVEDCVSFHPQRQSGFEAHGKGTKAKLMRCEFLNSTLHGLHVSSGAQCSIDGVLCRGAVEFGIFVAGYVTKLTAISCVCSDNNLGGVAVSDKANATLRGCTITGTKTGFGAEFEGNGTDITMVSCKVAGNKSSGIMVGSGALAALRDVVSSGSVEGAGLEVHGKGSEVWLTRGEYTDNPEGGVITVEGKLFN